MVLFSFPEAARAALFALPFLSATNVSLAQQSPAPTSSVIQQPAKKPLPVFEIPSTGVVFQTGDTWSFQGATFRLYGVQSCIRGTTFTNAAGVKTDCGEASLAYLAAIIRDTKPRCTALAQSGVPAVIYSVCAAHVGQNVLDLGTILINQGFAFAATDANGKPINVSYSLIQEEARSAQRGLWAAKDLPDPNMILNRAAQITLPPR